jgi:hypothetical protein
MEMIQVAETESESDVVLFEVVETHIAIVTRTVWMGE